VRPFLCLMSAALMALVLPEGARAAGPGGSQPRAWVSALGSDAANCGTIAAPCRSFQYVHDSVVAPGGTIYVKDSANYGQLVITHGLSIISDAASTTTIFAPSGDAIAINAGVGDYVFIKGLVIDGVGAGANGVRLISGGGLGIADCVIRGFALGNFSGNAILIEPASINATFTVSDTILTGNGYAGIRIAPGLQAPTATASVNGTLNRVEASKNAWGVSVEGNVTSGGVRVLAIHVNASENGTGFYASQASLNLSRAVVTGNTSYGVWSFNTIYTYGDNAINGNAVDVNGAALVASPLK